MSKWLVTLSIKNKEGRHDYFKDCYVNFEKKKPSLSELEKVKDSKGLLFVLTIKVGNIIVIQQLFLCKD